MTKEEFEFHFDILNKQSKWDSLWVNLLQVVTLGTEHEDFARDVIKGFVSGETPHPDLIWQTMEMLKERASKLGHNFRLVTVSREDEKAEKRKTNSTEMH